MKSHLIGLLKETLVASCTENISRAKAWELLLSSDSIYRDHNTDGHVTASCFILSPNRKSVLLHHHQKLNYWLPPGGHAELYDEIIHDTARREAIEETGIQDLEFLSFKIFDIDCHEIPEHKGVPHHVHYDFNFLMAAKSWPLNELLVKHGFSWVSITDNDDTYFELESMKRMRQKVRNLYFPDQA